MSRHRMRRLSINPYPELPTHPNFAHKRDNNLEAFLGKGFPYSRKLTGHSSCINALAFSSGNGRFLASGGDDLRIFLWDFYQEDVKTPSCSMIGPRGNIFTLAFSATNQYLYSGGTDETVLKYDMTYIETTLDRDKAHNRPPSRIYREHRDSIRAITCHPMHDEVFMSASEDGSIRRHDGRAGIDAPRAQDTLQITCEVTGVQYHPTMEHIFATSDNSGKVCLRDGRMAFGPMVGRTNHGIVQTYNTKLTKSSVKHLSNPESSSVVFDREGTKLAVTMLHYFPTIYGLSDPNPLAVCSGRNLPDGSPTPPTTPTYSNSCTMKHGSFGGPGLQSDELYAAGSDDFRGYLWKVPSLAELSERRREVSPNDWATREPSHTVGFTKGFEDMNYVPVELSTPVCRLAGHDSIVNTTLFHPYFLHVVTSGIEKDIILHSPTASSPCTFDLEKTPLDVRQLSEENEEDRHVYYRALAGNNSVSDTDTASDTNERTTISMFDHIRREEGEADVFAVRRWRDSDDSDNDSDYSEESESDLYVTVL